MVAVVSEKNEFQRRVNSLSQTILAFVVRQVLKAAEQILLFLTNTP